MKPAKPRVYRCPRCKKWEVWSPTPDFYWSNGVVIEGFSTWREAMNEALRLKP